MYPQLGLTRTVIRRNYALIAPDGYVPSVLPGWTNAKAYVLISGALPGARVTQMIAKLDANGRCELRSEGHEWVIYVLAGAGTCHGAELTQGGFAYVPPGFATSFVSSQPDTRLLLFRKTFQVQPDGAANPPFVAGHADDAPEGPFLGDPRARLKTLLPDVPAMDLAVNIFTYDPGATLPFVETHVMEHGMYFLSGSGVYRLADDWLPVQAGDTLWIAPYCPQWFIAAGPAPARYIYYKDVNRLP